MKKSALVLHSGGMDSSICLALACQEFGKEQVLSVSFSYGQRHSQELIQAAKICEDWGVDHRVLPNPLFSLITENALVNPSMPIQQEEGKPPNTLVIGRNGLMAQLAGIYAHLFEAKIIYLGVMELEEANSGYRDCSRAYMDRQQELLRIDLGLPDFEIRTPLVSMTKLQTLEVAHRLGILPYLLEETISCYEGVRKEGCRHCPACQLRNEGVRLFREKHPELFNGLSEAARQVPPSDHAL